MHKTEGLLPFMMAKPYSGQQLETLLHLIEQNGLEPHRIYGIDRWSEVAREIYGESIKQEEFKIGLEGHIKLVNIFFGDRAVVILLRNRNGTDTSDIQEILALAQKTKAELRTQAPGGESLKDIIVFMNLDRMGLNCDFYSSPSGVVGIKTSDGGFREISGVPGRWDYYYFKYVHVPDDVESLNRELGILEEMGVLDPKNEISVQDFLVMAKLRTLTPLNLVREHL